MHKLKQLNEIWDDAHIHFINFGYSVSFVGSSVQDDTYWTTNTYSIPFSTLFQHGDEETSKDLGTKGCWLEGDDVGIIMWVQ